MNCDEHDHDNMPIRKAPSVSNVGVKSKLRRTSDINGIPYEKYEPAKEHSNKSDGEGLWMKLNHVKPGNI